ncbi:hypothetical protein FRB93_012841 [Tulasnella sp. JGI-2019a]|nr:hypothetical protein FRB93_012841 [Tulasnella sp. JGI-2019a]
MMTTNDRRDHIMTKRLLALGSFYISRDQIDVDETSCIWMDGSGVVRRARMVGRTSDVAVKFLNFNSGEGDRVAHRSVREMLKWSRLQHDHVLPLIGFHISQDLHTALIVYPLEPHRNISDYIRCVRPGNCTRLGWGLDTLCGLVYLHELVPPIVHGNIKAANVHLNADHRAVLSDFEFTIFEDYDYDGNRHRPLQGIRFQSPEMVTEEAPRTVASDVWSWGCLLIEIMKEVPPYSHLRTESAVVRAMLKGISPWPEDDLKQPIDLWSVVEHCWNADPTKRVGVRTCEKYMRALAAVSLKSAPNDEQRQLLKVLITTYSSTTVTTMPMFQRKERKRLVYDENHQVPASKADAVDMLKKISRSLLKRTPAIPNEVLDLIVRHCSRFSLFNCCHVNRRFYSIAVIHLYEDPFAVDRFDYLGNENEKDFQGRMASLLKTLEDNNHLGGLVRVFRNRFWNRVHVFCSDITRILPHLKPLAMLDFDARNRMDQWRSELLATLAALRDHSPSVERLKFNVLADYILSTGDSEMLYVLSSSFLHLRDIDVATFYNVDELPLVMVQTIAKTCLKLRFVQWKSRSYYRQQQAQRIFQFALIDDVWETLQDTGIQRVWFGE